MLRTGVLLLCVGALPSIALSRDFFLTIGGGYARSSNQASLEKNVLLFQNLLRDQHLGHLPNHIYFSDGTSPHHDVQVLDRQSVPKANRLMAEFFGTNKGLGLMYRDNQIRNVCGDNRPECIQQWFNDVGSTMKRGDRLVLYVTAHGKSSKDKRNAHNTTIATWNHTAISMTKLVEMLDGLPDGVDVVTIMVQCHSGGFARFMFNDGDPRRGLSSQRRVGFFATTHDRAAAGCTAEIDESTYVEYSTYFWAAISGRDRMGNLISTPDYNEDGVVSFDEAHAYTVMTANTIDLPLKTSDEFLRVHSRFGNGRSLLTNHENYSRLMQYATAAQKAVLESLSEQLELTGERRVLDARSTLKRHRGSNYRGNRRQGSTKEQLRRRIANDVKARWPQLTNTLNPDAIELLTTRSHEFIKAIEEHPSYKRYRAMNEDSKPNYRKVKVKYERFLREADSVALAENLRRLDQAKMSQYENIVNAEGATLGSSGVAVARLP